MAGLTRHYCEDCGLNVYVSGGRDLLMMGITWTIACQTCGTLQDRMVWRTGDIPREPFHEVWWTRDTMPGAPTPKLACRRNSKHPVQEWRDGMPCPKCGGEVKVDQDDLILAD